MKLWLPGRFLKSLGLRAEVSLNRRFGREFIPAKIETFCIETSSACNLKCRFCAYDKKQSPRLSMSNELFIDCVEQALALGYKEFHLTPCTGDVFMDRQVFGKFEYMDARKEIRAYHFFTNFTIPDEAQILRLLRLKKLSQLTLSIYGHDEESFIALTRSSPKIYRRLLSNLETLLAHRSSWPFAVDIGFRSTFDVPRDGSSELLQLIKRFRAAGVGVQSSHGIYNNWGGYVSQRDVGDLNLHILTSDEVFKSGACVKLFDSFQVTASGIVNGCSCRDVDSSLKIGDLNEKPLREILSGSNPDYLRIIEEQQAGQFRAVCRNCDYYRSIYHQPSNFRRNKIPTQTMASRLLAIGRLKPD
ncbi:MAG: radical SAM protein [Sterolibacterium sp.]